MSFLSRPRPVPSSTPTSAPQESQPLPSASRPIVNPAIFCQWGGGDDNSLYLNGDDTKNTAGKYIAPIPANTKLNAAPNTYGYTLTSNSSANIFQPLTAQTVALKTLADTASPSQNIDETTNIYWGAYVGTSLDPGTYYMANGGAAVYYVTTSPLCATYTINFHANGGTGTMTSQTVDGAVATTIKPNTFEREFFRFDGWNTEADGSGTSYADETELNGIDSDLELYAQWLGCREKYLCFDANGAEDSPTKNDKMFIDSGNTLAVYYLLANNFQRSGYAFVGWNTKADGTGTMYGPGQRFIPDDNTKKGARIFATWVESAGTIQNWKGCDSLGVGKVTALTDARDNNTYAVAKLKDGRCWMVDNLRLGEAAELTALNTNNPSLPLTNDFALGTTSNHLTVQSSGNWCNPADEGTPNCINQSRISTLNTTETSDSVTTPYEAIYSYGNYYNWYSATGGSGKFINNTNNQIMSGSICPAGWQLPSGGTDKTTNDFYKLAKATLGGIEPIVDGETFYYENLEYSRKFLEYPINMVTSGERTNTGSIANTMPIFWTSSSSSVNTDAYYFYILIDGSPSRIWLSQRNRKSVGRPVRCLVAEPYTINYNANGGTGTMASQTVERDAPTELSNVTFTAPAGKAFKSWNTKADGSGISYLNKQSVSNIAGNGNSSIALYAQWGCPSGAICYEGNGDDGSTTMANQTTDRTTLWAPNFKRTGYGFASWNTESDGSGTNYGPNQNIAENLSSSGLMLYANWVKSDGTLQNWGGCANLATGSVTALTDNRDGDTYAVAKLADGQCWLIENLRLDDSAEINSENTDAPTNSFKKLSASSSAWCTQATSGCINTIMLNTNNTTDTTSTMTSMDTNVYAYGNYYNWYAATAGTGTYSTTSGSATGSICPVGWKLPTGNNKTLGSYAYLDTRLGGTGNHVNDDGTASSRWRTYPNNFVYSGMFIVSSTRTRGTAGSYPSSVPYVGGSSGAATPQSNIYHANLTNQLLNPAMTSSVKYYGYAVRCLMSPSAVSSYAVKFDANGGSGVMYAQNILRDTTKNLNAVTFDPPTEDYLFTGWNTKADGTGTSYSAGASVSNLAAAGSSITLFAQWKKGLDAITTMQEMTPSICSKTTIGFTKTLRDTRDNNTYTVRKVEDGRCWMTQNLRLGSTSSNITLTPSDSDVTSNFTINSTSVMTSGKSTWGYNEVRVYSTGNSWVSTNAAGATGTVNTSGTPPSQSQYIGNYYNWYTATAGTGTQSGVATDGATASSSICPKGWKLPTGGANGELATMIKAVAGISDNTTNDAEKALAAAGAPNYLIWGGQFNAITGTFGGAYFQGMTGSWQTRTAYNANQTYYSAISAATVFQLDIKANKNYGYSVRCVAGE